MSDYQAKILKLRNVYTGGADRDKLERTERALKNAILAQELINFDVIIQIVKDAKRDIENIDYLLAYDEDLNKPDNNLKRTLLFERRKWIQSEIVDRFSCRREKETQERIEKSIDAFYKRAINYENLS